MTAPLPAEGETNLEVASPDLKVGGEGETERLELEDETNRLMREHWLLIDLRSGQSWVTGCHCGFKADLDSDCGYGDSVVRHIVEVALATGRASAAAGEVRVEWGVRWAKDSVFSQSGERWSHDVADSVAWAQHLSALGYEQVETAERTTTTSPWQPVSDDPKEQDR